MISIKCACAHTERVLVYPGCVVRGLAAMRSGQLRGG